MTPFEFIFLFYCSPVTPKFDIPATESAVQRATTIYQRRRQKLLSGPTPLPSTGNLSRCTKGFKQIYHLLTIELPALSKSFYTLRYVHQRANDSHLNQ